MPDQLEKYEFFRNDSMLLKSGSTNFYTTDSLRSGNRISVVGIDSMGCRSVPAVSAFPYIIPYPESAIYAKAEGICLEDSVTLRFEKDPAFISGSYHWSTGEVEDTITVTPPVTTEYTLYYSSGACVDIPVSRQEVKVDTQQPPVADAGEDVTICIGDTVRLSGSGGMSYAWQNDGTLDDPFIADPLANPMISTIYVLTAKNTFCQSVDSVQVTIDLCLDDITDPIPQIITPNGDGLNDIWMVNHIDYFEKNSLRIYNRWGNLVFEANPYNNTWDGKSKSGADLPDGTYFFILDPGNGAVPHKGYIIIHR